MLKITLVSLAILGAAVAMPKPDTYWGDSDCGRSSIADAGSPRSGFSRESQMIVGGWETLPHEYPYQIALLWFGSFICGGSVVSTRSVITAAHCVEGDAASRLAISVGEHRRNSPGQYQSTIAVSKNTWHPNYDTTGNLENDVAVLNLAADVVYSDGVQPICPPTGNDAYIGQTAIVSGWGTMFSGGSVTNELRAVDVPVMSYSACAGALPNGWVLPGMLCAGVAGPNDKDACQGDSGGPLAVKNSQGRFELVGIVSWGIGCAASWPGVYAETSYYESWFNANVV